MNTLDKWSILAGVRFLLASIVAIQHMENYIPLGWLGFITSFGTFEAILGFLLISGYSIGVSYGKQPGGFLLRRIHRLYPIYIVAIAATYLAFILLKIPTPPNSDLALNAIFLNQLFTSTSFVGPAWSLSLEFWLYCLVPVLTSLSKASTRLIVFGSFACYLIYTITRTLFHMPYYSGVGFGLNLVFLSFIWVAGFRLARAGAKDDSALRDIGLIFGGHMALAVVIQFGSRLKHHEVSDFFLHDATGYVMRSVTLILIYLVFKHLVVAERRALRRSSFLRFLGDVSYPMYLLHASLYAMLAHFGLRVPIAFYLVTLLVSAFVCWMLDFCFKVQRPQEGTALPEILIKNIPRFGVAIPK